ncbi:MAG: hypothetical protein KAT70_07225 [Thermoplasmata archaeon]|nr:hypothetical protein [Thermoplasmata archaeon]
MRRDVGREGEEIWGRGEGAGGSGEVGRGREGNGGVGMKAEEGMWGNEDGGEKEEASGEREK